MTGPAAVPAPVYQGAQEMSLLALGSVLLRHRYTIIVLGFACGLLGLFMALTSGRVYTSSAVFIPQASESNASGLALAASQFGITLPSSGNSGSWGPSTYLELLRSRELLEPIARDTVVVAEEGNRRVALEDLFKIKGKTPGLRTEATVNLLRGLIVASDMKTVNGVQVRVTTPWPSVSFALASRAVSGVNDFNLQTRRSQAVEELKFVEAQADEAQQALHAAEDRLQSFLQANRVISSPQLTLERDRLQRQVVMLQELQTSWLKNREDARIREVRDTPVITVFEAPRLPLVPESRKVARTAILGGIVGGVLGILIAFGSHMVATARREKGEDARQFFDLVEEAKPRFLRKVGR